MNKRTRQFRKMMALKNIPRKEVMGNKRNCSKFWKGVTYEHYRVMSDIVWKLASQDYECYTEVTLYNGSRADIVAISPQGDLNIIEVLHTESEKKYTEKLNKYPIEFNMVSVRTKDFNLEEWDL